MNSNKLIGNAIRYALMTGTATALASPAVLAQSANSQATSNNQNQNQNANTTTQLGKIEVTGTRILRTSVETAQPVTIVTNQEIKQSGLTSIGDVLASLTSVNSVTNLQVNNGGDGSNTIALRNLGAKRTLVLVNGKRWVPNLAGSVDLNELPSSIIDHIEILQDGASAIYGSDAIAGVVNIITVKNFNGSEADAYMGIYHGDGHWDGKDQQYSYTMGSSTDRSGLVFSATYTNQSAVWAGNRSISKEPLVGTGNAKGSSGTPYGRFLMLGPFHTTPVPGAPYTGVADVTLTPSSTPIMNPAGNNGANFFDNTIPFSNDTKYNFAPLNYLITPTETESIYIQGHYDLADNLTFTSTALYNNRNSQIALAGEPFFIGAAGTYAANGQVTDPAAHIGISKNNPYNPYGVNLTGNSHSSCYLGPAATCDLLDFLGRRYIEGGLREHDINVDTFYWNGGLNGFFDVGGNEWDWDVGASFARREQAEQDLGSINTTNLATGLGPGFNAGTAANPNYECGAPGNVIAGCVPINLFGGKGSITPAMQSYLNWPLHNIAQSNQRDYTADISGTPFNLPAGPFGLAVGGEYLENDGYFSVDQLSQTGNSSNGTASPTFGRETTKAEYVEFNIPILSDVFLAKDMSLDLANRWSQFRWFGGIPGSTGSTINHSENASTGRAALRWQPTEDLLLRGSWSQGFRLPTISEFFAPTSFSFLPVNDPCAATSSGAHLRSGPAGTAVPKFCPAGTSNTAGNIVGRPQPNSQILNLVGGNPNLTPERSISRTAGFVYNPDWFPGFDFSADYYKISIVNSIGTLGNQNVLNACFYALTHCDLISPNIVANPSANNLNTPLLQETVLERNIGSRQTEGVDVGTHYRLPSTAIGNFVLGLNVTFVKTYDVVVPTAVDPDTGVPIPSGFATSHLAGFAGFPKQRGNFTVAWNFGNWSANYQLLYVGHQTEDCPNPSSASFPTLCSAPNDLTDPQGFHTYSGTNWIGSGAWTNAEVTYHIDPWNTDVTFGIRNLWDKDPPISISAFANSFEPGLYPTPGRFFYARVGVKF